MEGLQCLAPKLDIVVIVDVLSFTTAVSVAVERGATVYPYRWADDSAASFAESKAAILLGRREERGLSLSPASLAHVESGQRLVMPSPNGSMLSFVAASFGKQVIAGSLRNAKAAADTIREQGHLSPEAKMAVAAFRAVEADLNATLMDCISGRELVARGFKNDVEIASRLNEGAGVPMLVDGAYTVEKLTGA
ncbi:2-phosphosulfolactate phosphatase [Alicyclobacillus sp. ALC3]|uniref:2-phosphosulfolactate phosphatase n=1 Tax=Alicyclobacillus sp. ALC3 TaxID=2796143 RepID=UPI002377EB3E|nr:2-phosphosulfolactate phosphatase [Alicyclobacillus sp. ALC3]WDL96702.1 2-phosphosulfolactate phosphatase [Alicyclobacillus sp. ALC3]